MRCAKGQHSLVFATMHIEPLALIPVEEEILRHTRNLSIGLNQGYTCLIGDFNCVSLGEGRLDTMHGRLRMPR